MKTSKDTPCYYLTSVTHKRLPVFRTDKLKEITVKALNEARNSHKILIFAYVIMPNQYQIITISVDRNNVGIQIFANNQNN